MTGLAESASTTGRRGATPTPVSINSDARSPLTSHRFEPCSGARAGSRIRKTWSGNCAISNQSKLLLPTRACVDDTVDASADGTEIAAAGTSATGDRDIVDAGADRVRREAPWFTGIAAAKTSAVSDRAYSSARTAHPSLVR